MKEVKTDLGTLRFNRNLALFATAGCLVVGSLIASGNVVVPIEPTTQMICGGVVDMCAIFPGTIAYKNHKQLKKRK